MPRSPQPEPSWRGGAASCPEPHLLQHPRRHRSNATHRDGLVADRPPSRPRRLGDDLVRGAILGAFFLGPTAGAVGKAGAVHGSPDEPPSNGGAPPRGGLSQPPRG